MRLTDSQMLAHWRVYRGLANEHAECSIEIFDNINLDQRLRMEMRQWYLDLLDNGDLRHLVLTDISDRLKPVPLQTGIWRIKLPGEVRRLVSLVVDGADAPVKLIRETDVRRIKLNRNPYSRSSAAFPTAIITPDGWVTLYCRRRSLTLTCYGTGVVDPGDEVYEMDESALALLYKTPFPNIC